MRWVGKRVTLGMCTLCRVYPPARSNDNTALPPRLRPPPPSTHGTSAPSSLPGTGKTVRCASSHARYVPLGRPGRGSTRRWGCRSPTPGRPGHVSGRCRRADRLSDVVRAYGFRVMGSMFWDYRPTRSCCCPGQHRACVAQRADLAWARVAEIRALLAGQARAWHARFTSLGEAVAWVDTTHPRVFSQ